MLSTAPANPPENKSYTGFSPKPKNNRYPSTKCDNNRQAESVVSSLRLVVGRGNIAEIRVIDKQAGRTAISSGYFSDFALAAKAVDAIGNVTGVYVCLNEVPAELLSRSPNYLTPRASLATRDDDILRRRWILVDLDPVRPADTSSNDAELQAAMNRAYDVGNWLIGKQLPEPVMCVSGNGVHLLVPVDFANDASSLSFVKSLLQSLKDKFSDEVVEIDRSVSNAARITRLYGSIARKGIATPERPHRRSEIVHIPTSLQEAV